MPMTEERMKKRLQDRANRRWRERMEALEKHLRSWLVSARAEGNPLLDFYRKNDWHVILTSSYASAVIRPDYDHPILVGDAATCQGYPMLFEVLVQATIPDNVDDPSKDVDLNAEVARAKAVRETLRRYYAAWEVTQP